MVVSDETNARRHNLTNQGAGNANANKNKMGGKSSKPTATSSDSSFESGNGSGKDGSGSGDTFTPLKKDKHNDPSQTETTVEVEERDEILEIRKQSSTDNSCNDKKYFNNLTENDRRPFVLNDKGLHFVLCTSDIQLSCALQLCKGQLVQEN